jgi:hypothetical protein
MFKILHFSFFIEFGRAPHFVRVGLSAPSPSGVLPHPRTRGARWCVIHALRWFRYYPSRAASPPNILYLSQIGGYLLNQGNICRFLAVRFQSGARKSAVFAVGVAKIQDIFDLRFCFRLDFLLQKQ